MAWDKYNSAHSTAYELRHNYAVENINSWTDEGFGFDAKLLYLSKSMGHCNVESTKYYYDKKNIMESSAGKALKRSFVSRFSLHN